MLYDNAEIPRAFLAGYQLTGEERYADVSRQTLEFVERELTHDEGGFFSTLDAQSENDQGEDEEGAFFVWTPEEVHEAIDDETTADLFCDRFGVTERGNFEGATVLTLAASVEDLAAEYDMAGSEVESTLETAREQAFDAREERPRPARDEKVLAGWNGLMIQRSRRAPSFSTTYTLNRPRTRSPSFANGSGTTRQAHSAAGTKMTT